MKQNLIILYVFFILFTAMFSCKKNDSVSTNSSTGSAGVSQVVLDKIKDLGFSTSKVIKYDNGYIVEGDIFLDSNYFSNVLKDSTVGYNIVVANEEHYRTRTTALRGGYRVFYLGNNNAVRNAVINAIARYNAENLGISFYYGTPAGSCQRGDINVLDATNNPDFIAISGFPQYTKQECFPSNQLRPLPYKYITFNLTFAGWDANTLTSVIAHEIGHSIGFRHTDYMNRSYSGCLIDANHPNNEGEGSYGAAYIPGTPVGPDPNSWMLACISDGVNRPFTANDRIALNTVY